MKPRTFIVVVCWAGWMVIALLVVQTNLIGFTTTTLRWNNPQHPNATFRWAALPPSDDRRIVMDVPRAVKVTFPRAFATGNLVVNTAEGAGRLIVAVNAPSGQTMRFASGLAGQPITVPISWTSTAVSNRTFTITLTSEEAPVTLRSLSLTLQRK